MKLFYTLLVTMISISTFSQGTYQKMWSVNLPYPIYSHNKSDMFMIDNMLYTHKDNKVIRYSLPNTEEQNFIEIGTDDTTEIHSIYRDKNNNIYVSGITTLTTNFTTSNVYNTSILQNDYAFFEHNSFIAKYNSEGILIHRTYVEHLNSDHSNGVYDNSYLNKYIAIDDNENLYYVGYQSYQTPIINAPFQQTASSDEALFWDQYAPIIVKLNADFSLNWKTFFCNQRTIINNIESCNNQLVVLGSSLKHVFNVNEVNHTYFSTPGAYIENNQQTNPNLKLFLNVFNTNGTRAWGTYLNNGNGGSFTYDLVTNQNDIYIVNSATNTPTEGTYFQTPTDKVLSKFNLEGNRIWSTYIVNSRVALDISNNIWIYGTTIQSTGISTSDAYQSEINTFPTGQGYDNMDAYHQLLSTDGTQLLYGTYFGDYGTDASFGIFPKNNDEYYSFERFSNYQTANEIVTQGDLLYQMPFSNAYQGYIVSLFSKASASNTKQELENLSVYPNPVEDQLIIENEFAFKDSDQVKVFTFLGQELKIEKQIENEHIYINTASWSSGIYLIEVLVDGKKGSYKVIKK